MPLSAILIISALASYSIGVWSEKIAGKLKGWHLIFFWIGLATDASGTAMMAAVRGIFFNFHTITGIAALLLMFVHAVWATIVLLGKDEKAIVNFHKFSVFVWTVWLIPFFTGFFLPKQM
ncbi:MAG: HsmA family protein [Candidatus Zixiibacteriota bacterium]|jgi:uncharacterized repeat protein (TIGR03987 family)